MRLNAVGSDMVGELHDRLDHIETDVGIMESVMTWFDMHDEVREFVERELPSGSIGRTKAQRP